MARRQANRPSSRTASTRTSTATRRTTAASAAQVDSDEGMGLEGAVALCTTIILIAACLMLDYHLGNAYGAGVFF